MLRILLFIGSLVVTIESSGYTYYPEVKQSYMFYKNHQKWSNARETCIRDGAHLAMPKNEAEALVLKNIFNAYPKSILDRVDNRDIVFLGFHDMFEEGEYVTDKGKSIQYYFHTWSDGQPDNYRNKENCGSLLRSGLLNDYNCDESAYFICQKNKNEVENLANSDCNSPDPAYKYSDRTNKCYKLHLNPKVWSEARVICEAEGGNLAIINSKAEEDFLVRMFANPKNKLNYIKFKDYAMIGFHDIFQENRFVTVEGDELQSIGYTNWAKGEPNKGKRGENCGSMHFTGGLNDFPCQQPAVFFCEIDSSSRHH